MGKGSEGLGEKVIQLRCFGASLDKELSLVQRLHSIKGEDEELVQSQSSLLVEWCPRFRTSDPLSFPLHELRYFCAGCSLLHTCPRALTFRVDN